MSARRDVPGYVYLLHFSEPVAHAGHYIGWSERDPSTSRYEAHIKGRGSPLVRAAIRQGAIVTVARVWGPGVTRAYERQLKNRKNAKCLCPICKG